MKKIVSLCMLFFLLSNVSAALIEGKETYAPGETLISKLGFLPLTPISSDQIVLLKDNHILIPSEAAVVRLGSDYFLYSSLPLNQSNVTIKIKNVYRMSGGSQIQEDIEKNISISGETVPYAILPGALAAREPRINLKIISYSDSFQDITIQEQSNRTITLAPGENIVSVPTDIIPQGSSTLHIGNYALPVYLDSKTSSSTNESENTSPTTIRMRWTPNSITGIVLSNKEVSFLLALTNSGSQNIKDVLIEYDGSLFYLPIDHLSSLDVNETYYFNITVKKTKSSLNQIITARYGNEAFDLPVTLLVTNNASQSTVFNSSSATGKYCLEIDGKVCSSDQTCSGTTTATLDQQLCCVGSCVASKNNSKSWIGYLLGALVLIILVIVGGRYFKAKKPEDAFAKRLASAEKKF